MADPITPAERAEVRHRHAAGESRNAIARAIGRAPASVSKIATQEGLRFEGGARVAPATEARRADAAARREQLAADALDAALAQVARADGSDTARDARDHATAARALTEVHARVTELARGTGHGSRGASMLDRLADALLGPNGEETSGEG
ncbi:helix-turn-helix domain-containing protein [Streptomyces litchfieldiae]|uniref:Helix-turn-helix domain-containing protein n=1 Tax=Streptomyces litchfieldiae TaxID=3075543 RepID=A0ABU2MZ32_9ACTN|nr:helix-turn-helix domain-containing protein [Streptomyces sp. DSM 44938]MDT0346771.1 helix-turn-helix domain-containing protein [Streptomyces sp. DSM 44938]